MKNRQRETDRSNLEDETDKVTRIHDATAQHWNWAYYNEPRQDEPSWLLGECMKSIKSDLAPRATAILAETDEFMKQYPRDSLSMIDIGCGPGGFILKTIAHFNDKHPQIKLSICGLDVSREMINYAKAHISDNNVELICETITNPTLKLEKEPFDLGIMIFILPWYGDDGVRSILTAARQKLKRDGTLILMDFSRSYSPWRGLNFYSRSMDKMADMMWTGVLGEKFHLFKRTPEEIEALLNGAGFDVVTCYSTEKKSMKKGMLIIRSRVKPLEIATGAIMPQEMLSAETRPKR